MVNAVVPFSMQESSLQSSARGVGFPRGKGQHSPRYSSSVYLHNAMQNPQMMGRELDLSNDAIHYARHATDFDTLPPGYTA